MSFESTFTLLECYIRLADLGMATETEYKFTASTFRDMSTAKNIFQVLIQKKSTRAALFSLRKMKFMEM
jgi:adenine-specific DNA methylase